MLWKTNFGKILILLLAVVAFVILAIFTYFMIRLDSQPVQKEHVEVMSKRLTDRGFAPRHGSRYSRYVTFKFPDGSEIEFNILYSNLDDFQKGDVGILSYKQIKDSTELRDLRFVSFEKDL